MATEIPVFKKVGPRIILIGVICPHAKVVRDDSVFMAAELPMPPHGNSGNTMGIRKAAVFALDSFELDRESKSDSRRGKEHDPKHKVIKNRHRRQARRAKQNSHNPNDIQE